MRGKVTQLHGTGSEKRQWNVIRGTIQGITRPAIRRLARRISVIISSGFVYRETRALSRLFLENLPADAVNYMQHGNRKTVTGTAVVYALNHQGRTRLWDFSALQEGHMIGCRTMYWGALNLNGYRSLILLELVLTAVS